MALVLSTKNPKAVERGGVVVAWYFTRTGADDPIAWVYDKIWRYDVPVGDRKPFMEHTQAEVMILCDAQIAAADVDAIITEYHSSDTAIQEVTRDFAELPAE